MDAHGLRVETSQIVESLRDYISLHISSGHCGTSFVSSDGGPPDLLPLKQHLPRGCLDIWLDYKRTSRMENARDSIVKAFSAPGVDILQLLLNGRNLNEDDDGLEGDEESEEGSISFSIVSESE